MEKKSWILVSFFSVAVLGTLTYLVIKNRKKSVYNSNTQLDLSNIDFNSQAIKITNKKLNQFKELLSSYEYKNNSLYNSETGGKISEPLSWSVWGVFFRKYNNLLNGVNSDRTINSSTKRYALNTISQIKQEIDDVFPIDTFNATSPKYFKYDLHKIKEQNVYNEKV